MIRCRNYSLLTLPLALMLVGCQTTANHGVAVDDVGTRNEPAGHLATPAIHPQPTDPDKARLAEANWQAELGNDRIARQSYVKILERNSQSADALIGLARLDQTAGRQADAEQGLKTALAIEPDNPDVIAAVAQFYVSQERWADARDLLDTAIQRQPDEITLTHQLAVVHAKSGQNALALEYFTQAVGVAEAHYNLAIILYQSGNQQAAEKHLLQALLLKPDFPDAKTWLAEITGERTGETYGHQSPAMKVPEPFAKTRGNGKSPPLSRKSSDDRNDSAAIEQTGRIVTTLSIENTRHSEISFADSRTDADRMRAKALSGTPLAASPIEPLSNAGGSSRNAQPVVPLTEAMTTSQREQWENQLRAQNTKR